jgi:hypothetical protein
MNAYRSLFAEAENPEEHSAGWTMIGAAGIDGLDASQMQTHDFHESMLSMQKYSSEVQLKSTDLYPMKF